MSNSNESRPERTRPASSAPAEAARALLERRRGPRIRRIVVRRGPCGYLVRDVSPEEWDAFASKHGTEATARARRYLETGQGAEHRERTA